MHRHLVERAVHREAVLPEHGPLVPAHVLLLALLGGPGGQEQFLVLHALGLVEGVHLDVPRLLLHRKMSVEDGVGVRPPPHRRVRHRLHLVLGHSDGGVAEEEEVEVLAVALRVEVHRLDRLHDALLQFGRVDGAAQCALLVVVLLVRPEPVGHQVAGLADQFVRALLAGEQFAVGVVVAHQEEPRERVVALIHVAAHQPLGPQEYRRVPEVELIPRTARAVGILAHRLPLPELARRRVEQRIVEPLHGVVVLQVGGHPRFHVGEAQDEVGHVL